MSSPTFCACFKDSNFYWPGLTRFLIVLNNAGWGSSPQQILWYIEGLPTDSILDNTMVYQLDNSVYLANNCITKANFPNHKKERNRQRNPSHKPLYPVLHWQFLLPIVSVQSAFELQPPLLVEHSLIFSQYVPLPEYPDLQVHILEPRVFEHIALLSQPPFDVRHSSISLQIIPLPKI